MKLSDIVTTAVGKCGIAYDSIDATTYISTKLPKGDMLELSKISIAAANFYDEEDVPMTLREVLAGILQPLGLRIQQRSGKIWVYDLNGLYTVAPDKAIEWSSDNQTLGVDKAVNNIKVIFSPYGRSGIMDATINHDDVDDCNGTNILYYTDNDWNGDQAVEGFNFITGYSLKDLPLEIITPDISLNHFV